MAFYRLWDIILESNIPLNLPLAEDKKVAPSFRFSLDREPWSELYQWFQHYCDSANGERWLSLAKQELGYTLRFHNLADFIISTAGLEIRCYPEPDTPLETIRHLLLDQVLPLALDYQGRLVLHAGAVVTPAGAIVFLGESGWGKSTLAASFCQQGYPVLTDDSLLLAEREGQIVGIPSYPGLRLWAESITALFEASPPLTPVAHYSSKKRVTLGSDSLPYWAEPTILRQIYVLASPEETAMTQTISLTRLSGPTALMALVQAVFRLDVTDRARVKREFEVLGRITAALPCFRLTFPRDHSLLGAVHTAILTNLNEQITIG